jgi:CRISPR-associated protein Csb2
MRHALKSAATRAAWSESDINTLILGHGESSGSDSHLPVGARRFAYLPVPSIEVRGGGSIGAAGGIRRIMLSSFTPDLEAEVAWARMALSGQELIDQDESHAVSLLSVIPASDRMILRYTRPADLWATVTPVVLPGYDDPDHYRRRLKDGTLADIEKRLLKRLGDRVDGLLRKAIVQAGFPEVLANNAQLEWRSAGFWSGNDLAGRYRVPEHLRRFPRFHVRLQWRDALERPMEVPGPICIGGGRFYGLGLFAAL